MEPMAHEVPVTQARAEFAELVNRVVYGTERVVVTRHGRPIVALVSAADLARLEQLDRTEAETEAETAQPATVIRLTGGAGGQPVRSLPDGDRHLGIAARHRPPGPGDGR